MRRLIPKSTGGKIWVVVIQLIAIRYTIALYPGFVFNNYFKLAFSIDLLFHLIGAYIIFFLIPTIVIGWIRSASRGARKLVTKPDEEE